MKTLNETIKAMECCKIHNWCEECPYNGIGACELERELDALHYLNILRVLLELTNKPEEETNAPLSWDELKSMEGKPVWVEILSDEIDLSSRWMMVARETKAHSLPLAYTDDIGHWIYCHENNQGKTWQVYRKERE